MPQAPPFFFAIRILSRKYRRVQRIRIILLPVLCGGVKAGGRKEEPLLFSLIYLEKRRPPRTHTTAFLPSPFHEPAILFSLFWTAFLFALSDPIYYTSLPCRMYRTMFAYTRTNARLSAASTGARFLPCVDCLRWRASTSSPPGCLARATLFTRTY